VISLTHSFHPFQQPLSAQDHKMRCQGCCPRRGVIALRAVLERSAYCCGEELRLRLQLENRQDCAAQLCVRLTQVRSQLFIGQPRIESSFPEPAGFSSPAFSVPFLSILALGVPDRPRRWHSRGHQSRSVTLPVNSSQTLSPISHFPAVQSTALEWRSVNPQEYNKEA
jgi:hypothetical protein